MKIITGKWQRRSITPPHGPHIRPTSSRSREAIFNMLCAHTTIHQKIVIDLFCGTGALGLEALSRGAKKALFVDTDLITVKKNIKQFNAEEEALTHQTQAQHIKHPLLKEADLIFMDPPYGKNLVEQTLTHITPYLKPSALIVTEAESPLTALPGVTPLKQKKYGKAFIYILEKA